MRRGSPLRSGGSGSSSSSRGRTSGETRGGTPRFAISESPTYVARGLAALAQDPDVAQFAGQVLTPRQLADRYGLTDTDGSRPDAWGYIATYGLNEQSGEDIERFR